MTPLGCSTFLLQSTQAPGARQGPAHATPFYPGMSIGESLLLAVVCSPLSAQKTNFRNVFKTLQLLLL